MRERKKTMPGIKQPYREISNFFVGGVSPTEGSSPSAFLFTPLVLAGDGDKDALG